MDGSQKYAQWKFYKKSRYEWFHLYKILEQKSKCLCWGQWWHVLCFNKTQRTNGWFIFLLVLAATSWHQEGSFCFLIFDGSLRLQIAGRWKLLLLEFFQTRARSIQASCRAQMRTCTKGSQGTMPTKDPSSGWRVFALWRNFSDHKIALTGTTLALDSGTL